MKIANILISNAWGDVSPDSLSRGIGGREGAMVYLSREWAKMGHEVTNFVNIDRGTRFNEPYVKNDVFIDGKSLYSPGYHEYVPLNLTKLLLSNFPWDVAIAWECPSAFNEDEARVKVKVRICEMQVAHLSEKEREAAENHCQYVAALSEWHKQFLLHSNLDKPRSDVIVLPNGVDISRYPVDQIGNKLNKKIGDNPRFVYSSSPDRGLWYLLQAWPLIREHFPNAELLVCYGAKRWTSQIKWYHGRMAEMAVEIEMLLNEVPD